MLWHGMAWYGPGMGPGALFGPENELLLAMQRTASHILSFVLDPLLF